MEPFKNCPDPRPAAARASLYLLSKGCETPSSTSPDPVEKMTLYNKILIKMEGQPVIMHSGSLIRANRTISILSQMSCNFITISMTILFLSFSFAFPIFYIYLEFLSTFLLY